MPVMDEHVAAPPLEQPADGNSVALRREFENPAPQYRPLIITHSAPVNSPSVLPQLRDRRAGGAVIDAGVTPGSDDIGDEPWDNPTYLNDPGQFAKLRDTLAKFKEAGLDVWLYDELGYPSGSAGGRVLQDHPEYQVEVVGCHTYSAATGEMIEVSSKHGSVEACIALPRHDGQLQLENSIDLTDQAETGPFSWQAPGGQWTVCLFERYRPDTWRRHNIPRRNVNILDRRAVAYFIELTHKRYATELGSQLGDVRLFFTDEPQFGSVEHWTGGLSESPPMVQWCDELPKLFRRKYGYDIKTVLPALFHSVESAHPNIVSTFTMFKVTSSQRITLGKSKHGATIIMWHRAVTCCWKNRCSSMSCLAAA